LTDGLEIRPLAPDARWDAVVADDHGLVFASSGYLALIEHHLDGTRPRHLAAFRDGAVVGVLPSFVKCVPDVGCVNNSSPFYGSHGGVYTTLSGAQRAACVTQLLDAWSEACVEDRCDVANVVEPLGNRDADAYAAALRPWRSDERIGQVIAEISSDGEEMLSRYHQKTRNMVRKAQRQGFALREEPDAVDFLYEVHAENMAAVGGRPKPARFFHALGDHLGDAWTIYTASLDDERVAALLVMWFGDCAEYYTPVTRAAFRGAQPMTLLVHHAIAAAAARGCRRFNFGGTWKTQEGVYRFKARFGATDVPYRYYVTRHRDDSPLLAADPASARAAFDGYYLFPMAV
jgi:hypothetical protein